MLTAAALTALPLAWRRLYPITAWLVIIAAIAIVQQDFVPKVALGTAVYAAYSAIAYSRYRNLAIAAVSLTTVAAAAEFGARFPQFQFPGRLTAIFVVLPAAAAGLGIRELRRRLADSTARLRRASAEAAAATERALAAERARIAAELHDVVTHNVSVMIVQAGAARKILASSPPDAETALLAVEATGRDAMAELRNLLGLLSPFADGREAGAAGPRPGAEDRPVALLPQPGLGELDALIGRVSAAGLPVELAGQRCGPAAVTGRRPGRVPGRAGRAHQRAAACRPGGGDRGRGVGRAARDHGQRRRARQRARCRERRRPRRHPGSRAARAARAAGALRR